MVSSDRRGAALVLALWVLLVLGMASLQILAHVRTRMDSAALQRSRTVARYASESGIVAAQNLLGQLVRSAPSAADQALVFDEFQRRVDSWGVVSLGTGRYQVVVEDLNARIDLNRSRPEVIEGLLSQFVPPGRAQELVRALRGSYFDEGDAAAERQGDPGGMAPPDQPGVVEEESLLPGAPSTAPPLMHLEELPLVLGFDESLAALIAPYVTVSGDGLINANSAPERVLTAIPYIGRVRAQSLIAVREQGGPFGSDVAVYSALSEGGVGGVDPRLPDLVTMARRVLLVARGWEEGRPYTHEVQAVFEVLASSLVTGTRVRLRSWTEQER